MFVMQSYISCGCNFNTIKVPAKFLQSSRVTTMCLSWGDESSSIKVISWVINSVTLTHGEIGDLCGKRDYVMLGLLGALKLLTLGLLRGGVCGGAGSRAWRSIAIGCWSGRPQPITTLSTVFVMVALPCRKPNGWSILNPWHIRWSYVSEYQQYFQCLHGRLLLMQFKNQL